MIVRERPASAARPRRSRASISQGGQRKALNDYVKTLSDPFDFGAVPLGFDCFCPTQNATAFYRGVTTPNADGSISFALMPSVYTMVLKNSGGISISGSANWSRWSATNAANLSAIAKTGRVVSGGLRVWVAQAATEKQGACFAATAADLAIDDIFALNSVLISSIPSAIMGPSVRGAAGMLRPVDNVAYEFSNNSVQGYPDADINQGWCCPLITFQGLPAAASVYFEAVLNLEWLPKANYTATSGGRNNGGSIRTLSDYFPSSESLAKAAGDLVASPVIMDAAESIAGRVHPLLGDTVHIARKIGNGIAGLRANVYQPTSTLTIEEIPNIPVPRLPNYVREQIAAENGRRL